MKTVIRFGVAGFDERKCK